MRLRVYTAETVADAMRQIRRELGDDAVIVSTETDEDGEVRITAALDDQDEAELIAELAGGAAPPAAHPVLVEALAFHGVPEDLARDLVGLAAGDGGGDAVLLLEGALADGFDFAPVNLGRPARPLMMVGIPGAGKTVTAAKLAARATIAGRAVRVISTDTFRAGARAQLAAFTDILGTELVDADGPDELRRALDAGPPEALVLIDTAGVNPFDRAEMAAAARLVEAGRAEPVLVTAAGGDPIEAAEIAACFAPLGVRRLVATRLDVARRLGGLLAAARSGPFSFAEASASAQVAHGLTHFTAGLLARLLLGEPMPSAEIFKSEKAAAR